MSVDRSARAWAARPELHSWEVAEQAKAASSSTRQWRRSPEARFWSKWHTRRRSIKAREWGWRFARRRRSSSGI